MSTGSYPWHQGEIRMQQRLGVAERMAQFGPRVVRDFMPDQHREFYAELPFLVLGSVDGLVVGTGDGAVAFMEAQQPNKKRMRVADLVRGRPIAEGTVLS